MKLRDLMWIGVLALALALVGCQKAEPVAEAAGSASQDATEQETGDTPDRPAGNLDPTSRLALGTFALEGTENAVTPAQAAALLPLWTMVQGEALKSQAERNAVLGQIEGMMTEAQLASIEAMALTMEDMQTWMQEQGIEAPAPPAGREGAGQLQNLSEEERAKMREEFQNMSAEERQQRMAEMGIERPEGAGQGAPGGGQGAAGMRGGGLGQGNLVLQPLIELLTQRAAE